MKPSRIISVLLVVVLMFSAVSFAASAFETDIAETGYYNQNYLETYASAAYNETNLGSVYTPSSTTFKVWAPEANSVTVKRYTTGTDAESGAAVIGSNVMSYNKSTGIWSLTLSGDHKNEYYTYVVDRNGVISETQDPYAHAVGANGDRSMIVDLDATDPDGWNDDKHVLFDNAGEAVVWEVHVRDFSIDVSSGVSDENKGKYLAFTEGDTTVGGKGKVSSCVDYLVEHNVNCVQLMPIEDFASIDETDEKINRNWGYDPKNYNVPEGSYSSDPYDGNTRITEFKMLVQALHDRGISVVMDVVYNHTFVLEGSALSKTTPKYYYRMSSAENYHNGSGLGNVLSSEKKMTQKYISESLQYWVNEYHIDGFRFDLMGCHDLPSMKVWRAALDKIDKRILMYGEPWAGGGDNGITNSISNANLAQAERVGAFNQTYSDSLKGDHDLAASKGFLNGGSDAEIKKAGAGQATYFPGAKVNQFINYTDNHDNLTLFDKILASNNTAGYKPGKDGMVENSTASLYTTNKNAVDNPSSQALGQMKLALTSALTSQGIPFTVAGTEFCRTKYGDANSYRSPDELNAIDWNRADKFSEVSGYYAGLIAIRKAFNPLINNSSVATTTVSGGCTAWQITNSTSGQWNKMIVALNNSGSAKSITLSGSWVVLANGTKAGTVSLGEASGSYSVPAYSGVVLVDKSSYGNYTQPSVGTATLKVEHYTRDSASGSYKLVKTETAKFKEGQNYRASKNLAILFDHNYDKTEGTPYGKAVAGQNYNVKFYYTRYIKSAYLVVNFLDTTSSKSVKTAMRYRLRDGASYAIPATAVLGYQLDTSRYPAKTRGVFDADNPVSFNFYYKALTNATTKVHYYNSKGWPFVLCYAYDDQGNEPLGAWPNQTRNDAMQPDASMGSGWVVIDVPTTSCYVMFHYNDKQIPGQGESGYEVSGEAWIKDGIVSFNNTIVTSHIELDTGKQLANDVVKENTQVSSNQIYATSALKLNREYITPANASGFYKAGVTNVVYLYGEEKEQPPIGTGNIYGDVDVDGEVTILDATLIQRYLAKLDTLNDNQKKLADVDKDNDISVIDATYIQSYLAKIKRDDSRVGEKDGEGGGEEDGKHTFSELIDKYNELSTKLAKYPVSKYGSNEYYIAASDAVNKYKPVTMNPSATPEEIDEAYDACDAALKGLDNIQGGTEPDPGETVTLYFSNNKGWDSVYVYTWSSTNEGSWPGVPAEYVGTNDYGQGIYSVTVDTSEYDSAIFNNGDSSKTADISLLALPDNGCYCTDEQQEDGGYLVGYYHYTGTGGSDNPPIYDGGKVYMTPSTEWKSDGARFAAYFFIQGTETYQWVNMKYAGDNLYGADIPSGYNMVIFVRMNGSTTENNWNNKWNQTNDIAVSPGSTYTVNGWEKG